MATFSFGVNDLEVMDFVYTAGALFGELFLPIPNT